MRTLRIVARSLYRRRLNSAAVILTIGLSIGTAVALFAVCDGLVFKPLPFASAKRLVHIDLPVGAFPGAARAEYVDTVRRLIQSPLLVDQARVDQSLVFDEASDAIVDWQLRPLHVTPSFFRVMGIRPVLGRLFLDSDPRETPRPVVVSHAVWRSKLGSDKNVIGRVLDLPGPRGREWMVVGVIPADFEFPNGTNFWIPTTASDFSPPTFGVLAPGVTARALMSAVPRALVTPIHEYARPHGAYALIVLLVAGALLTMIACVQVAGIFFAQVVSGARELGIRIALGSTRGQLVHQCLLEAALVVGISSVCGWLLAWYLKAALVVILPSEVILGHSIALSARVLLFTICLAAVAVAILVVLPIRLILRLSPADLIHGRVSARVTAIKIQQLLLYAQIAITAALAQLGSLALTSYSELQRVDLGFNPSGLQAITLPVLDTSSAASLGGGQAALDSWHNALWRSRDAASSLPGVLGSAIASSLPMQPAGLASVQVLLEADQSQPPLACRMGFITRGVLAVIGARLLEGREPDDTRAPDGSQYGVVTSSLANVLRRHGPVIGQIIAPTRAIRVTVAAVIDDIRLERLEQPAAPTVLMYYPGRAAGRVLLLRTEDATKIQPAVRATLAEIWGPRAPPEMVSIVDAVRIAGAGHRSRFQVLLVISGIAMFLASVGTVATLRYLVQRSARDFTIRMSLGASPSRIRWTVGLRTMSAASVAAVAGLAGAGLIANASASYLYNVRATDAASSAVSLLTILTVVGGAVVLAMRQLPDLPTRSLHD